MKFTNELEKKINETFNIVSAENMNIEISQDLVCINHMGSCKVSEISLLIQELTKLKDCIEGITGVIV